MRPVGANSARPHDCILLAAGTSSRMGRSKQVELVAGSPLFSYALETALAACRAVVLVEGAVSLRRLIPNDPRITLVTNEDYRRGQLGSLQRGLQHRQTESAFIMLADLPLVRAETYHLVAAAAGGTTAAEAAYPTHAGRRGHPVFVGPRAVELLMSAPPERRAMEVIEPLHPRAVEVDDEGIYRDVDTPGELSAFRGA
ncbi:MAG: nucleotidyltransferase family protein [Planctomycetota bacterium]